MSPQHFKLSFGELASYSLNLGRSFLSLMAKVLKTLKGNWLLLLLIPLIVGGTLLVLPQKARQSMYEAKMVCGYSDNHSRIFGEMLDHLNTLLLSGNRDELAQLLGMSVKNTEGIESIEGKTFSMGALKDNYATGREPFYIFVRLRDKSVLNDLENGLLNYLSNATASRRSADRQAKKWADRIRYYRQESSKIDSLKEAIRLSYLQGNKGLIGGEGTNPIADLYKLSDSMSFYLSDCEYYLAHYASVEPVMDFIARPLAPPAPPFYRAGAAAIGSFLILLFLLTLINLRRAQLA